MTVTIESRYPLGQRVQVLTNRDRAIWEPGTVYKIKWDRVEREFKYLIEKDNEERVWTYESEVIKA